MMRLDEQQLKHVLNTVADEVIAQSGHLTGLDQAIGDGDHGLNMKRGFEAVLADLGDIACKPLPEALKAVGMSLVMKVGGASGPLYGTWFMALGKSLPEGAVSRQALSGALGEAAEAVKQRGKSDSGQKTMLDVLMPVAQAVADESVDLRDLPAIASSAAETTVPMLAIKGRASFLGERSIGHMDPGACSSALIVKAACRALEESA